MKRLFVIGGMGAGKSTATRALVSLGFPSIDLDKVGHDVLKWDTVKEDLVEAFGADILDENGEVVRGKLAEKAFVSEVETRKLNRITLPRIEERYYDLCEELAKDNDYCVVEYSVFKDRDSSFASSADVVLAVLAPFDVRVQRAVAAGWDEEDVRRRMARQITDAARLDAADVVFNNMGTREELEQQVLDWWKNYQAKASQC